MAARKQGAQRGRGKRARARECGTKAPLADRPTAIARAKALEKHTGGRYRAYRCPHCTRWHVGHTASLARRLS